MAAPESLAAARGRYRLGRRLASDLGLAFTYLSLVAACVVLFLPMLWAITGSLKSSGVLYSYPPQIFPREWQWVNYLEVFRIVPFLLFARNSVIITVTALTGQVLISALVAYGFARFRFRGRNVLFVLLLSTMMLPQQVILIPQYLLYAQLRWIDTYLPLIVPAWFGGGAFFIFLLRQFILTINPELDDAARIDGCGWLGIYLRIALPLIKPALAAVAIFSFLGTWNDFFGPLIFLRSRDMLTLAVGLHFMATAASSSVRPNMPHLMAGSTMLLLPPLLVFFFAQRYFIQGVTFSGIKG